jgi:hypothetical protein
MRQLQFFGSCIKSGAEMTVLDIVAERAEADLRGRENNLGRANEPSGVIDNADRLERRGVRDARPPDGQRGEGGHRTGEQGGGAMVLCRLRRDQQRVDTGRLERNGAEEAGRPTADHSHFGTEVFAAAAHASSCHYAAKD